LNRLTSKLCADASAGIVMVKATQPAKNLRTNKNLPTNDIALAPMVDRAGSMMGPRQ
jgi:hypothetical protein